MKPVWLLIFCLLLFSLVAISLAACNWGDSSKNSSESTPQPGDILANDVTATFGANQFHVQLTAMARPKTAENNRTQGISPQP